MQPNSYKQGDQNDMHHTAIEECGELRKSLLCSLLWPAADERSIVLNHDDTTDTT
jgi:hypothetical protein